jgi:hypothetical protein
LLRRETVRAIRDAFIGAALVFLAGCVPLHVLKPSGTVSCSLLRCAGKEPYCCLDERGEPACSAVPCEERR